MRESELWSSREVLDRAIGHLKRLSEFLEGKGYKTSLDAEEP